MVTGKLQTPEEGRALLERVQDHDLPEDVSPLVESYAETVGDRDQFLWKWAHHLFPKFTLSSVSEEQVAEIQNDKLVGLMFVSVLDDVAEKHGDRATFEEAAKIPFDHLSPDSNQSDVDQEVVALASELWDHFSPAIFDAPRSAEFQELIRFDLKQVLNAIDYSFVANQDIAFVNGSELRTYEAHNMMVFAFADIDVVHSPNFDRAELATLRRVIERAQRMVRIGNWITTWERELHEADFTSGIVVYALENGIVTTDELIEIRSNADPEAVERIAASIRDHNVEAIFVRQWNDELAEAREFEDYIDSVDVEAYLDGVESVMDYHLASRGLK